MAADGPADTIKPRLEQLGADCNRVHVIDESERELSFTDERLEAAIVKTGARLLILDPIQAYLGGADMHSANGVRPLMKHLTNAAESRHQCGIRQARRRVVLDAQRKTRDPHYGSLGFLVRRNCGVDGSNMD